MTERPKARLIKPPLRLADCVEEGTGPDLQTILKRMNKVLTDLKDEYIDTIEHDLSMLDDALSKAMATEGVERQQAVDSIYQITHEQRGLAGAFDYPLATEVGSSLCSLIERLDGISVAQLQVIELHVNALKIIWDQKITGDGGPEGQQLVAGMETAAYKVLGGT